MRASSLLPYFAGLLLTGVVACSDGRKPALLRRVTGESPTLDTAAFASYLQEVVGSEPDTTPAGALISVDDGLRKAYSGRGYTSIWLDRYGKPDTTNLFSDLRDLQGDGLSPENYNLDRLRQSARSLAADASIESLVSWDTACTRAYLRASRDLLLGVLLPRRADSLWYHANDSLWSAPVVLANRDGAYAPLDSFRSALPAYQALGGVYKHLQSLSGSEALVRAKEAIARASSGGDSLLQQIVPVEIPDWKRYQPDSLRGAAGLIGAYQAYYGAKVSGKLDSSSRVLLARPVDSTARLVRANLERLRWLPRSFGERYIEVNIPMLELRFNDAGREDFRMRVVVGKPSRQTPALQATMTNVVFNPSWGVPPTILKKDVMPGVARSGAAYLAKKGLHAYDRNGREVSAGAINPGNYRGYVFRQPPGPRNALGDVKFNLPNRWDIYLHDTPHREDFPKRNRALSSGCIRVQRPREFAEFILTRLEDRPQFTADKIDSIVTTRKTRFEILKNKIPVHIVYLTAGEDNGAVRFYPDIYKRDGKLLAQLP